jgi:hypothetical protein
VCACGVLGSAPGLSARPAPDPACLPCRRAFRPQVGVVDVPSHEVVRKGRLMPGNIFLVDFDQHRVVEDAEVRRRGRARALAGPGGDWRAAGWEWL